MPWVSEPVRCRVCRHQWVAVVEVEADAVTEIPDLECPNCLAMAGELDGHGEDWIDE